MKIKTSTEILVEMWTQMYHDMQSISDEYADDQGIPTETIDKYLEDGTSSK